ncbi:MAG TPA: hypothetical protein VKU60_10860, partial [Chloroflexota bacterium]|nr:hypothetical protein [Chloroflexota bacterium]
HFLQLFRAKFPDGVPSSDSVGAYVGMQVLSAALEKVNGNIEQTQPFLNALYATDLQTAKGPLKLDKYHDVIESAYIYQMVKQDGGLGVGQKLLQTYPDLNQFGDLTEQQAAAFPWGKLKGQWVGMTKDKLATIGKS